MLTDVATNAGPVTLATNGATPDAASLERVPLSGTLAGYYVDIRPDELNVGFLEDLESGKIALQLTALVRALAGGNLPYGIDRAGLRRLKSAQFLDLFRGVTAPYAVPKS